MTVVFYNFGVSVEIRPYLVRTMRRLALPVVLLTLISCGGDSSGGGSSPTQPVTPVPTSISIAPGALVLEGPGDTATVTATILANDGSVLTSEPVTWSSDDPSTATVSTAGKIVAVEEGTTLVRAQAGSLEASLTITVDAAVQVCPSGGELALVSDSVTLSIPAGALPTCTFLTVGPASGLPAQPAAIAGTAFDFGPDGLVFAEPVRLTVKYDPDNLAASTPESELRLHKLVANGFELVDSATVDTDANTVSGLLTSFSVYAAVRQLGISTSSLPEGAVGVAYSPTALGVNGGNGSYEWSIASSSLPDGLTLSPNGVISGAPEVSGSFAFALQVVSGAQVAEREYEIAIAETVEIVTTEIGPWTTGAQKSIDLEASGGGEPHQWSVVSGSLPSGLTLSAGGTISGVVTSVDSSTFTVQVTGTGGQTATSEFTISAFDPLEFFDGGAIPVVVGTGFSTTLQATGGDGTYSWVVIDGALPAGVVLDPETGLLSGTPSEVGGSTVLIQVTSGDGQTDTGSFEVPVVAVLVMTTEQLPSGVTGEAYSVTLTAVGGDLTYSWSIESGTLPAGLTLSAEGAISGIPTSLASATFSIQVTSDLQMVTQELTIEVFNSLSIEDTTLPIGIVGEAYTASLAVIGGDGTYSWAVTEGELPAGLQLEASTGALSGVPTGGSPAYTFTASATSDDGQVTSRELTIVIYSPLVLTTETLPDAVEGVEVNVTLEATGGDGTFTWSVTAGALPAGLVLSTGGAITGVPTSGGTQSIFTVQVATGDDQTAAREFTVEIYEVLQVSTVTLSDGLVGSAYDQALIVSGGNGIYAWSLVSGVLPSGLELSSTGQVSGTTTVAETFEFGVEVTSGDEQVASRELALTIAARGARCRSVDFDRRPVGHDLGRLR